MALAMRGTPPTGYKLTPGRSVREWSSPDAPRAIEAATGVKMQRTEWLSPAQAEKALGKKKATVADFITKKPGAPRLVTADHDGPDITPKAGVGGFDVIEL
jgi:hypothetical protein